MINKPSKILVIKSNISELKHVEEFLYEVFREYNLPARYYNKTYLCISEAVVNSIKHGNQNDSKKNVSISVECI